MIGGLLFDALVVAAVVGFAWVAPQLGGLSMLGRLVETVAAVVLAVLLRDPVGDIVESIIGASDDVSRLVGMVIVAAATAVAVNRLIRWWRARRLQATAPVDEYDEPAPDRLDSPLVARIAGGVLGLGWALLFVALIVLQPSSTPWSRAAIDSRAGGAFIAQEDALRWLNDGFPHYTQALPKGSGGAVVGETATVPMRRPIEARERAGDPDDLLRPINAIRRDARTRVLTFNPDIAAVARRQAIALAEERTLMRTTPGGASLEPRVLSALGSSAPDFAEEVGIEVAWAHDPATAFRGLVEDERALDLLRDERWTEVGIGVADAGWFNGRIYVLLLVGPVEEDERAAPEDATRPSN